MRGRDRDIAEALADLGAARRRGGEQTAALAALQTYLQDDEGLTRVSQLTPETLVRFVLEAPLDDAPLTAETHAGLAQLTIEWVERLCREGAPLDPAVAPLRRLAADLPRCYRLVALIETELDDRRLGGEVAGVSEDDDEQEVALFAGPANQLVDLGTIDYERAAEDEYRIARVEGDTVFLRSPTREALGEGELGPLLLPKGAGEAARPDDILKAEVAPTSTGWVVLYLHSVTPGGYE